MLELVDRKSLLIDMKWFRRMILSLDYSIDGKIDELYRSIDKKNWPIWRANESAIGKVRMNFDRQIWRETIEDQSGKKKVLLGKGCSSYLTNTRIFVGKKVKNDIDTAI